jgi:hypothetical protein
MSGNLQTENIVSEPPTPSPTIVVSLTTILNFLSLSKKKLYDGVFSVRPESFHIFNTQWIPGSIKWDRLNFWSLGINMKRMRNPNC